FGLSVFGMFGAFFFWWPKMTGRFLNETLGKIQFWTLLFGFNLTFFFQHYLGVLGMPRRIATYGPDKGWAFWNLLSSLGAYLIAISVVVFIINFVMTMTKKYDGPAPDDP